MISLYGVAEAANIPAKQHCALTWGNFDGVHLGHQALLAATARAAARLGLPSLALTFEPRPSAFFNPAGAPKAMVDLKDKLALLERQGLDYAVVLPFNEKIAALGPEAFLSDLLLRDLGGRALVIGHDSGFGSGRSGNLDFLRSRAARYGYSLEIVAPVSLEGRIISSTWAREKLASGELAALPALLGRQHSVHGRVLHGFQRGRELGFATANLDPSPLLLPPGGVYACLARCEGRFYAAACNLGNSPSFGQAETTLEAHLLDFSGDLYDKDLRLYFIERLRAEETFTDLDALARQIGLDVQKTREIAGRAMAGPRFAELYPL